MQYDLSIVCADSRKLTLCAYPVLLTLLLIVFWRTLLINGWSFFFFLTLTSLCVICFPLPASAPSLFPKLKIRVLRCWISRTVLTQQTTEQYSIFAFIYIKTICTRSVQLYNSVLWQTAVQMALFRTYTNSDWFSRDLTSRNFLNNCGCRLVSFSYGLCGSDSFFLWD